MGPMTGVIIPKEHMTMFSLGILRSALTVTQVNTQHFGDRFGYY